jgi:hypothetical protein
MEREDGGVETELAYWKSLAEERGRVIRALHEFNYWHESTVARGEVIAGLEQSVALWRERCLACEANNAISVADATNGRAVSARLARIVRRVVHRPSRH